MYRKLFFSYKRYKTLAPLKFSTATYRVVVSTDLIIAHRDIKADLFHEQCPLCASYQIVCNPVVYVNACKQSTVLLAHPEGKSNPR